MFRSWVMPIVLSAALGATWTDGVTPALAADDPIATFKKLDDYISSNPLAFKTSFSSASPMINTELSRGTADITAIQPNQLLMDTTTSKGKFLVVSDGKTLTMLDKTSNNYAQTPAPETFGAMIVLFTGMLAVDPHTLLFLQTVKTVANGQSKVEAASTGAQTIGGQTCNKYTVSASDGAIWEAWLQDADIPLPCRLVSRDRGDPNAAVQTNNYTWATTPPQPGKETFKFTPPNDGKLVRFGELLSEQ